MANTPDNTIPAGGVRQGRPSGPPLCFFNQDTRGPLWHAGAGKAMRPYRGVMALAQRPGQTARACHPLPRPKLEAVRAGSVQDDLPESCPSCGEEDGIVNAGCCRHGKAAGGIEIRNSVRHRRRMPDAAKGPGMIPRMWLKTGIRKIINNQLQWSRGSLPGCNRSSVLARQGAACKGMDRRPVVLCPAADRLPCPLQEKALFFQSGCTSEKGTVF